MKKSILAALIAVAASAITPARAVDYYDPSDGTVKASPNATTLTTQTLLSGGWYVVPAGTTTINDRIIVSNNVNLVLCDGATLNANSGISVTGGNSLTIWGQGGEHAVSGTSATTRGTGALNAQTPASGDYHQTAAIGGEISGTSTGDIVINGGVITARGAWGAGIGRGNVAGGAVGSVTINEGHVTASGSKGSAGIGSGAYADSCPVTISGGYVVAVGCVYDATGQATPGIGTGRPRTNGSEPLSNGTITITGGTVIAEAGTPPSDGTAAQAIGVNAADTNHNGTAYLVLGAVRAYASAGATTPVAVSARGDACRGAWVKLEACTGHIDANSDLSCDDCGGYCGQPPSPGRTVTVVTRFHQSYPYSGKATVEYTIGGTLPANAVAEITVYADDASATFVQSDIVAGANSRVIDFASSFGGALLLTNASFSVTITGGSGGVQLWAGGPYWAECNVGATTPGGYGYYFWWGDTVGYTRRGGTWNSDSSEYSGVTWVSSTGEQMGNSPFNWPPTSGKSKSQLLSEGYIDSTGNLVAAHDAATAHLGSPWRMPTSDEFGALIDNCTTEWTTQNGIHGRLVTGKGAYADRSIFLPAAGYGFASRLDEPGFEGQYWSSTPYLEDSYQAWRFYFFAYNSGTRAEITRARGYSVRPVRGSAPAVGIVTYDPAEIVIDSVADWNALSDAVASGVSTEGVNFRLACDIGPVTTMVGTSEHPFAGVFDGGSNTLTVALSGAEAYVAPFARVSGASIRNLKVAGTVSGALHCSGLVGGIAGTPNRIEGCEVAAAITTSGTHCGGFVGHGGGSDAASPFATTLRGCVFSGSIEGGTAVGTLWGWSDTYALPTLENCLDASASAHPIGRGSGDATVSNVLHVAEKETGGSRPFAEGKRGARAFAVSPGEGVELGFGEPLLAYGGSDLAVHPAGLAHGGSFYAEAGASVGLSAVFTGTPPAGKKHDAFQASAGDLAKNGDAWELAMPAGDVVVSATFADATAYEIWAAANGIEGAWDETDALGIHNVFRYAFDKPAGAFAEPPLLDIAIEGGNAVVKTPPVVNAEGFAVSVVESSDIAGTTVTRRRSPDAAGRAVFAMEEDADSRFYRLAAAELGGVQLWAGGPYWANCNIGAATPEEYGYYFWWGDTVGYKRENDAWVATDGSSSNFSFEEGNTPTYGKDSSALRSAGYIDSTGNLVAAYDAATAHLGSPWRMPTDAEFAALRNNCTTTWTTRNGVYGRLVTGRGAYADKSIFLPAAGDGGGSNLNGLGSYGLYWSSTPYSDTSWGLYFYSGSFVRDVDYRYYGRPVRPVRDAD